MLLTAERWNGCELVFRCRPNEAVSSCPNAPAPAEGSRRQQRAIGQPGVPLDASIWLLDCVPDDSRRRLDQRLALDADPLRGRAHGGARRESWMVVSVVMRASLARETEHIS